MGFSAVFLTSYLVYHYNVGNVRFSGQGWVRSLYFSILIPHVILAGVIVPLAIATIWFALHGQLPPPSSNRAMDLAAVDVRLSDGRDRLPDVLPTVHADISTAGNGNRAVRPALKQIALPAASAQRATRASCHPDDGSASDGRNGSRTAARKRRRFRSLKSRSGPFLRLRARTTRHRLMPSREVLLIFLDPDLCRAPEIDSD